MVPERLPGICALNSTGHQVCGQPHEWGKMPNRLHGMQRQAVAWWLEEESKLEQLVCKTQGWNRPEVGGVPGQKVWEM